MRSAALQMVDLSAIGELFVASAEAAHAGFHGMRWYARRGMGRRGRRATLACRRGRCHRMRGSQRRTLCNSLSMRRSRVSRCLGAGLCAAATALRDRRSPRPRFRSRRMTVARATLLALLDRLRNRSPVGLEASDGFAGYLALDQSFDVAQERMLVDANQ